MTLRTAADLVVGVHAAFVIFVVHYVLGSRTEVTTPSP
jgi:hypothetical protein